MILKHVLSFIPSPLPTGMTAFEKWSDEVIELTGPLADKDSMKYALASMILHAKSEKSSVPKRYFVHCLRKSAANQVSSQVFQDIKLKQEERNKRFAELAAEEAISETKPEVTTTAEVTDGEQPNRT